MTRIGSPTNRGLLDTRYLVKTGITGGQTAIGGTAVTDILKLQGTSGNGTAASPAIQLLVGNNGATVALTVLNNGNVGIGTTGPGNKLHVSDTSTTVAEVLRVENLSTASNTTKAAAIDFNTYDTSVTSKTIAQILAHPDTNVNSNDGVLAFFTRFGNNPISTYERMRIDSSGNVGIGTTSPSYDATASKLVIAGTGDNGMTIVAGTANKSSILFADGTASDAPYKGGIVYNHSSDMMTLWSNGLVATPELTLKNGNVGIGTTNPDRLVHAEVVNTTTNAVSYGLRLTHICPTASTGLANGGGVGIEFELETATDTTNQIAATIESAWVESTNATRKGNLSLYAYDTAARLGIQIAADGSVATLGFYGVTPVVRPTALTAQLTTVTCSAPGTPDYAIADLVQNTGFGFVSADEGQSVLKVIANLQTRVSELETKLQGLGILT